MFMSSLTRSGQLLNLNWEKLPESVMYDSVLGTVQQLSNVILVDYTATEDIHLEGLRHIGTFIVKIGKPKPLLSFHITSPKI